MKPRLRQIILERMYILVNNALYHARVDPQLSQRQATLAKKLSTRHKVAMPYELRMVFCKKCKLFIAPGVNSRIRKGRDNIKITCNFCGHVYRKST